MEAFGEPLRLALRPVYSRLATADELRDAGLGHLTERGIALRSHQLDTWRAVNDPSVDVIFNSAITGDGKSLAGYLPSLLGPAPRHLFATYPTNELLQDQERQFAAYRELLGRSISFAAIWGEKLTDLQSSGDFKSRGAVLLDLLQHNDAVLTNPDIFSLILNYNYDRRKTLIYSDQELPYSLVGGYDLFLLDEFHVFSIPQFVAAVVAVLAIREMNPASRPTFLFSSATPDPTLSAMIARTGLSTLDVAGDYSSEPAEGWALVLHPTELLLHLLPLGGVEEWLAQNVRLLTEHFGLPGPHQALIVVNSVLRARRLAKLLAVALAPAGLSVGEITGLTDRARRAEAWAKDVIVGTSTIDVGVDFQIDLLFFEASTAGDFLQRLGRLARQPWQGTRFQRFTAHALLPGQARWLSERWENEVANRGLANGDAIDRATTLREIVQAVYPQPSAFLPYASRWGSLQAAHVVTHLRKLPTMASVAEPLAGQLAGFLDLKNLDGAIRRYYAVERSARPISDEVVAFRGSSPFQAAIWDVTVNPPSFVTYNLFALLTSAEYVVLSEADFRRALAAQQGSVKADHRWQTEFRYLLGSRRGEPLCLKLTGFAGERGSLRLRVNEELRTQDGFLDRAVVLSGFRVEEPRQSPQIAQVNEVLAREKVVCCARAERPDELALRLRLPPLFSLYPVRDVAGRERTVAFGKEALILDAIGIRLRNRDPDGEPIIL